MKYLIIFLFSGSLYNCSSTSVDTKYQDLEGITNKDFKPARQIHYKKQDDILKGVQSKLTDALNSESIQRIYKYEGTANTKGEIATISQLCYERSFKDAFVLIKKSGKIYLKNPIFWNTVGTCFLIQGERRKALLFYNKALSLKANYAPALNNLGVMYIYEKDYSRALVAFTRAHKTGTNKKTPRFNLANLYLSFGLYDKVISMAAPLLSTKTKDVDLLNIMATAYLMKGDYKRSLSLYNRVDDDYARSVRVGTNYSLALYYVGQKGRAKDVYENIGEKSYGGWTSYYRAVGKLVGGK